MLLSEHPRALAVHWRILLLGWLGWLSVFTTLMLFNFLAGLYGAELGLDDAAVGRVKAFAIGATGLGGLLIGIFGDRMGRRPAMALSLAVGGAGVAAAAAARSETAMLAAAAVGGLGIGGQWASGQTLVGETVPPVLRGRFGALCQSGAPLGLALASVLAFEVAPRAGWRPVFVSALLPVLLIPVVLRWIPESDLWLALRERVRRGELHVRASLVDLFAPDVRRIFGIAFLLTLLCQANYWFTVTWLPELMRRNWDLTLTKTGLWTLVFAGGSLAGYLLFNAAAARIGRRPAFSLFCLIMATGTAMLTVFEGAIRGRPELALVFAGAAGVGTGIWSSFGPLYTEIFPTRVRTTAGGICMNVSRGLNLLAPPVVVAVGGRSLLLGVALAAVFAAGAAATIWLLPETRGRKL